MEDWTSWANTRGCFREFDLSEEKSRTQDIDFFPFLSPFEAALFLLWLNSMDDSGLEFNPEE